MTKYLKYIYLTAAVYAYVKGAVIYSGSEAAYSAAWAVCCGVFVLLFIRRLKKDAFYTAKLKKIDKMSGEEFERYLEAQFKRLGYHVSLTERSHDYGADLVLRKRKKVIVVQAKRYDKNIGIKAVQEIIGAIKYYEADAAMVVTNQYYTKSAIRLAEQNEVELWTRDDLIQRFGAR